MSSTDKSEKSTTPTKSNNVEIMTGSDIVKIIRRQFDFLQEIHQEDLEESMKGTNFVFDYGDGLHYKCHKIRLRCGGPYKDSPKLIKDEKAKINQKNKEEKGKMFSLYTNGRTNS